MRLKGNHALFIDARFILMLLRVVLAAVMIYYGWPKIRDLRANARDFVDMGFKPEGNLQRPV